MPINPELFNARLTNASNVCETSDVVVDGRKLTEKQANCLYTAVGRALVEGTNLKPHQYDFLTKFLTQSESSCIDVVKIGAVSIMTINRLSGDWKTTRYYADACGHSIMDIFLASETYDALIKSINE